MLLMRGLCWGDGGERREREKERERKRKREKEKERERKRKKDRILTALSPPLERNRLCGIWKFCPL